MKASLLVIVFCAFLLSGFIVLCSEIGAWAKTIQNDPLTFSDSIMSGYDKTFSVQQFFNERDVCLKDVKVEGKTAAAWIEMYCSISDISQRFFIAHLDYEQSLMGSRIQGKHWIYPYDDDGTPRASDLAWVLKTICGVSGGYVSTFHKFYGYRKQIELCASIYRRELDAWKPGMTYRVKRQHSDKTWVKVKPKTAAAWAMFVYTPYDDVVVQHKRIYRRIFGGG